MKYPSQSLDTRCTFPSLTSMLTMSNRIVTTVMAVLTLSALGLSYAQPVPCNATHVPNVQTQPAESLNAVHSGHADCGACQSSVDCCCLMTVAQNLGSSVVSSSPPVVEWAAASIVQSTPTNAPAPTTPPPQA